MSKKIFYKEYLCKHKPKKNSARVSSGDRPFSKSDKRTSLKNKIFTKKISRLKVINIYFVYSKLFFI